MRRLRLPLVILLGLAPVLAACVEHNYPWPAEQRRPNYRTPAPPPPPPPPPPPTWPNS